MLENNALEFVITDHFMQNVWDYLWQMWISSICVVCGAKIMSFYEFSDILGDSKSKSCKILIISEHWWIQNFNACVVCQCNEYWYLNWMAETVHHNLSISERYNEVVVLCTRDSYKQQLQSVTVSTLGIFLCFFHQPLHAVPGKFYIC